jgi:hypothetical protein
MEPRLRYIYINLCLRPLCRWISFHPPHRRPWLRPEIRSSTLRLHRPSAPWSSPSSRSGSRFMAARARSHQKQARRARFHWGFVFKFLQSPATRSYHIYRSSGVIFFDNLVDSFSTDARRGLSTLLFSPQAIPHLTAGEFFSGCSSVVSLLFRSRDLYVIRSSLEGRFILWLLNI